MESQREQDLSKSMMLKSGILEKWHDKTFKNFEGDKEALAEVEEYIQGYKKYRSEGVGGLLYGSNGTGKTYLLNCLFKELLFWNREEVYIVSFPTIISNYTKNWRGEGNWSDIINVPMLGIEEIGKEFSASGVSKELVVAALDALLRYRVQRMKPTWFTTNLMPPEIIQVYGKSLSSLFKESSKIIEVKGDDYRNKLAGEINPKIREVTQSAKTKNKF